jgi:hypothetical protein
MGNVENSNVFSFSGPGAILGINAVTCRWIRATTNSGYRSDDWIYWHFG